VRASTSGGRRSAQRAQGRIRKAFAIGAAWLALVASAQGATTFRFRLDEAAVTSANVVDEWGTFVRTLSRGEALAAGTHELVWDNRDQAGNPVEATTVDENGVEVPLRYGLKLLRHQVSYTWEGVIGNTSAVFTGPGIFRAFKPPTSLALHGNNLYFAVGYNEMQPSGHGFALADPTRNTLPFIWRGDQASGADFGVVLSMLASDGQWLYWANTNSKSSWSRRNFVLASDPASGSYVNFAQGHLVCLNYRNGVQPIPPGAGAAGICYEGQFYPSVIDENEDDTTSPSLGATGIAVQTSGPLLAVAHGRQGVVKLFDKRSGAERGSFPIPGDGPEHGQLTMSPNGELWVISGTSVLRYTDLAGTPTLAGSIGGFSRPLAVAVHPADDDTVVVADGGSSQQVKAFHRDGQARWTFGRPGGYGADPTVANDRLWFRHSATAASDELASIAVVPDGSFWVTDSANSRLLHISNAQAYVEQVAYRPVSYTATVDPNNPRRVFSNFHEYDVDPGTALQPGDGPSWRLVRNWAVGFPVGVTELDGFAGLGTVNTLPNGRTYALALPAAGGDALLVELPAAGPARDTGVRRSTACGSDAGGSCMLYENGELGWVTGPKYGAGGYPYDPYQNYHRKALLGFDAAGNPQWAPGRRIAGAYAVGTDIPVFNGGRTPITGSGQLVLLDTSTGNQGAHLAGQDATVGGTGWNWLASFAGWLDGKGSYQTQAIDHTVNYAGNWVWAVGPHIVYGYHGEGYTDRATGRVGQANQFMHFQEDGLFVGQFGAPLFAGGAPADPGPGQAGNAFANILLAAGPNALHWYHNDESNHGGVHRWRIGGIGSMVVMAGVGALDGVTELSLPESARAITSLSLVVASTGTGLVLTATVSGNAPGGTVQFYAGGQAIGGPVAVVGTTAELVLSAALAAGVQSLTAVYSGDGYNLGSGSPAVQLTPSSGPGDGSSGDVPLPPWAGLMLAAFLGTQVARRSRRSRRR
jgi:hypothetical protein